MQRRRACCRSARTSAACQARRLSANGGTTPSTVNLNFNVAGLANGIYAGSIGVVAPGTTNQWTLVPVTLKVTAPPPCNYSLSKTATSVPANGGASYVNVGTSGPTCGWTAVKSDTWITITSGGAGTGNGRINYTVAANASPTQRSGSITVDNQTLVITQFGSGCSFGISPVAISTTAAGGTLPVSVAASNSACSWSASSASGLGLAPSGGAGSAAVQVTVPPNTLPGSRALTATIAGQVLTVNQSGINCTVTLSPYEATVGATGTSGSIAVTTQPGCSYDTMPGPSWIRGDLGRLRRRAGHAALRHRGQLHDRVAVGQPEHRRPDLHGQSGGPPLQHHDEHGQPGQPL